MKRSNTKLLLIKWALPELWMNKDPIFKIWDLMSVYIRLYSHYNGWKQIVGLQWHYSLQLFHKIIFLDSICKKEFAILFSGTPYVCFFLPPSLHPLKQGFCNSYMCFLLLPSSWEKFKFIWHGRKAETLTFNSLFLNLFCVMRRLK